MFSFAKPGLLCLPLAFSQSFVVPAHENLQAFCNFTALPTPMLALWVPNPESHIRAHSASQWHLTTMCPGRAQGAPRCLRKPSFRTFYCLIWGRLESPILFQFSFMPFPQFINFSDTLPYTHTNEPRARMHVHALAQTHTTL